MKTLKTFSRTTIAVGLASCFFVGAATANSTPVALTSATFTSHSNELPTLPTYNVAANANGEFALSLLTSTQTELLIFGESGSSLATPVTVPLSTSGSAPSGLAVDQDGDVAVAWNQITGSYYYPFFGNATITNKIYVQRYSSSGTAEGSPILVATQVASDSISATDGGPEVLQASSFSPPQIAMDDDGDVAVAWTELSTKCQVLQFSANGYCYGSEGTESSKTYAALYSSAGAVTVAPKVVDSLGYDTASQSGYGHANLLAGMRMSGAGNLVLLYVAARDTTVSVAAHLFGPGLASTRGPYTLSAVHPIYAQYLASEVSPQILNEHATGLFKLPSQVFGGSRQPSYVSAVGMDASGNFDVAWLNGTNDAIFVTRYDSSGNVIGSNIGPIAKLVTSTNGSCGSTVGLAGGDFQLSVAPSGSFVVTWGEALPFTGTGKTYASCSLEKYAQFYNSNGTAKGSAVVISQGTSSSFNTDASLSATDGNGKLMTVWNSIASPKLTSTDTLEAELVPAP